MTPALILGLAGLLLGAMGVGAWLSRVWGAGVRSATITPAVKECLRDSVEVREAVTELVRAEIDDAIARHDGAIRRHTNDHEARVTAAAAAAQQAAAAQLSEILARVDDALQRLARIEGALESAHPSGTPAHGIPVPPPRPPRPSGR